MKSAFCLMATMGLAFAVSAWGQEAATKDKVRLGLMKGGEPKKWDLDANFAVFLELIEKASAKGVELFITPECWLDGYASADKESTPTRLREIAQSLDSSAYLSRVADEARRRSMFVCFGFTSLEADEVYNAAGLWNTEGRLIGVYHKTHLQNHDLQFSPGKVLPTWKTPWGTMGTMICADRRWPETTRTLRLQGARLILNPTYGMHNEMNEIMMRTRAYENQCFIAFSHPVLSLVLGPKGDILGKLEGDAPDVLAIDIDLSQAKDDNHLRDRRPDLYEIIVHPKDE